MRKILLVENEPFLSEIYAKKLRERGYEIFQSADDKSGWNHFQKLSPHLVVLNIAPPQIDGLRMLRRIRAQKSILQASVPVVLLSDEGDSAHIEMAMLHGANEYMAKKEHSPEQIIKKILKLLETSY